ncbi:MAG: folylpolyglutamate synthase [Phycisphaeraceae bacterium]|nr:MAG: folylpolyglutamate synthase [Phycisphaeraceae bacterium]
MPRATTRGRAAARTAEPKPAKPPAKREAEAAPMTYAGSVRWLEERVNVEAMRPARVSSDAFKLDRMRALLANLDNPHQAIKTVHVAGSKGKGSVCEMLASCLGACGYTVGLFTSPHLVDVRERVRLAGDPITQYSFAQAMNRVREAAERVPAKHGVPTYFELLSALALRFFADKAVDIAVVEVGLGGRLDSTNVITPEVSAITTIQLEHTQLLGDTVEKIALEKAGIMKPGVTTITVPQEDAVLDTLRAHAAEVGATLAVLGQDIEYSWRFVAAHDMGPHARVSVSTARTEYEHLAVPLLGEHQAANCGVALAILDRLRERGFEAPERDVAAGLAATPNNGRLEEILDSPRIIVDGAHTPTSIKALVQSVGAHIRYDSMVVIFGCAADKDVDGMLTEIARGADKVIFTKAADSARAADPADLERRFTELSGKMAQRTDTLKEAINTAARAVGREDLICITGSFHLAGEAKKLVQQMLERKRTGAGA